MTTTDIVVVVSSRTLAELETIIERGMQTFVEVGKALLEIRDARLYRATHGTWDVYCRERWGWSRIHAHRHIEAAQVVEVLPTGNTPTPSSERVARELAPLLDEPAKLADAWDSILQQHGPEPTAAEVREVVGIKIRRVSLPRPVLTMCRIAESLINYTDDLQEKVRLAVDADDGALRTSWIKSLRQTQRAIAAALRLLESDQ